jgi:cold shock CspA family protein
MPIYTIKEAMSDSPIMRLTGQVKWFNVKVGYGFVTVLDDGEHKSKDIFTHYSAISGDNSQYKYLVQGEYLEFDLVKSTNDKHEYHAVNISGIKGGEIMCQVRKEAVRPHSAPRSYKTRASEPTSDAAHDSEEFVTKSPRKSDRSAKK